MEEENKKTTFLFVLLKYLLVFLLKFRLRELVGCRIKFRIQQVPTRHTFDGPRYPKNKKYPKKWNDDIIIPFFRVFLVFGVARSIKSIPSESFYMQHLILHPMSSLDRNLTKITGRYVKNTNKKSSFFLFFLQINKYYFIILTIILLIFFRRPILS